MKNNLKAFTLAEMLLVLIIIGVIAALMVSTVGFKTDRSKGLFKKAYSSTERTVVELVNDEMLYPYDFNNFGFEEKSNVCVPGTGNGKGLCTNSDPCTDKATCKKPDVEKLKKFCFLFANSLNLSEGMEEEGGKCSFTSTDGVYWEIKEETSVVNGFLIYIDTNGEKKGPNMPDGVENVPDDKAGATPNRDRFYMYVRNDGKMQLPKDDNMAKKYLKSSDLNEEQKDKKKGE